MLKRIGIGCGGMTRPSADKAECISIIREAAAEGTTLIDTVDFYSSGNNELLIGEALKGCRRENLCIVDKFGALMNREGAMYGLDVHPQRIPNYLAYSLNRLKTDYIDVYMPARIDLAIPVEETVGEVSRLAEKGYVKEIGLSQVDAETLKRAEAVHHISYLEVNFSLFNRKYEKEVFETARAAGTKILAFGVLAHGALSGSWSKNKPLMNTLASPKNIEANLALVQGLKDYAEKKGLTLPLLASAWVMSKGDDIYPILGMSKKKHYDEMQRLCGISLRAEETAEIEALIPEEKIKGEAFPDMRFKNGEVTKPFFN